MMVMSEYKIVVAPGHEEYLKEILQKSGIEISICPTDHEVFLEELKNPVITTRHNNEPWRGKGKRRMQRVGGKC